MMPPIWVIDLDGVVWRGQASVPGSADAIDALQRSGATVVFATNNSALTPAAFERRLEGHGITAGGRVVTSAQAAASLIHTDEAVLIIGEDGLHQAVDDTGAINVTAGTVDTVVVGICRRFDYSLLRQAARAVHSGARLIATNTDATFPASDGGLDPGAGSIVAALEIAGGAAAVVAGKPNRPIADLISSRWGGDGICVGDRPETDGKLATALNHDFALVLSGVTTEADLPVTPTPAHVAADLAALVALVARLD